ncbi:hypothetical protein FNF27_04699 [Cafeteria roenbergensis]|uniref:CHCH domain-containing protein n=1 Tax=Cafeteria roenbergensis TaxID=33653 RepID=A0A5A8E0B1_CAFRO|nr:hypothetical protein FNF29_05525 [Cafeteria roenbergensis]KAA0165300.1 hypothetical protein FNF31_01953 [Cafeteria roenbergensis]KAA0169490.1 hypothetical protein FNF28_02102 [Cafeteria roenbergensis]KAA0173751.1 hypothetical protein FNF27_04699 [Cafeteria roenbergensis]|eukprot:KAA0150085.1 hypothetical protein FNF29_05525 [Cafeteria roenbergensis]
MEGDAVTRPKSREECYVARDAFHACLTQFEEDKSKCTAPHEEYKAHCMKSWRKYFDSRRKAGKGQVDVGTYRPGK